MEIGFDPLDRLRGWPGGGRPVAWLDPYCGSGNALIRAQEATQADGLDVEIVVTCPRKLVQGL